MEINWIAVIVAALVPTIVGFLWYGPMAFQNAWMKAAGIKEEDMQGANMGLIFGIAILLSLFLAMGVMPMVIHQMHIYSIFISDPAATDASTELGAYVADFMAKYGGNFRTFQHGGFHGLMAGIFIVLPILGTNALFERKGWRYILINVGYWTVTLAIMGAIICGWQ